MAFSFPDKPAEPTPEEAKAMEQWLRDGTVPADYVEALTKGCFSTAEPPQVKIGAGDGTRTG